MAVVETRAVLAMSKRRLPVSPYYPLFTPTIHPQPDFSLFHEILTMPPRPRLLNGTPNRNPQPQAHVPELYYKQPPRVPPFEDYVLHWIPVQYMYKVQFVDGVRLRMGLRSSHPSQHPCPSHPCPAGEGKHHALLACLG